MGTAVYGPQTLKLKVRNNMKIKREKVVKNRDNKASIFLAALKLVAHYLKTGEGRKATIFAVTTCLLME